MTELNTDMRKGRDGWVAETDIALDRGDGQNWKLTIHTGKRSRGGIYTSAGVSKIDGMFRTTRIFRDFRATVISAPNTRCTEKAVRELHQRVLTEHLDAVLAAEKAWEAEQQAKEAADKRAAA